MYVNISCKWITILYYLEHLSERKVYVFVIQPNGDQVYQSLETDAAVKV